MRGGAVRQADVQCPFYQWDDGRMKIQCEGFGNARSLIHSYHRIKYYHARMVNYCCNEYKKCEVYRILMQTKYRDED